MSKPEIKWRAVAAYQCAECGQLHEQDMWSSAPNPFDPDPNADQLIGCVHCYAVNSLMRLCAAEGCLRITTCGTNFPDGQYRLTCGKHMGDV